MKNYLLCFALAVAALLSVAACQKSLPEPVLTQSHTEVPVSAEGVTYSIAYKVSDPREGAEISVEVAENDWLAKYSCH